MITSLKRIPASIFLACLVLSSIPGASEATSLGEELESHDIEAAPNIVPGQERRITSYGTYDSADVFYIGFYIDNGTQNLNDEMHLGKFDKGKQLWTEKRIDTHALPGQGRDASPCAMMAGSVMGIERAFGNIFVRTHGNPSAGCTLVLSEDLAYRDALYGFVLGALDAKTVVFEHSEVHFAPTHYVEVSAYNLVDKRTTLLYPPKSNAPIRGNQVNKVRAVYEKMNKSGECMRRNHHCNPELFNCHLVSSAFDPANDALVLQIAFDNKDGMNAADIVKIETFREFVRGTELEAPASPIPDQYFSFLSADLNRARNLENMGRADNVSKVIALFDHDPELQGMIRDALDNLRTPGRVSSRDWFLKMHPTWNSPDVWKRLIHIIKPPQEWTQVAYIYRHVTTGKPEFAEVPLDTLHAGYGRKNVSEYLHKDILNRLIK